MSLAGLLRHDVVVRPLATDAARVHLSGRRASFRSSLGQTVALLGRELDMLDADRRVLQLDYDERHLRADGLPKANARRPGNPAVVLSFESRFGPQRFATGEYDEWEDNLRAIALSLEALRAVDRYGVSKRGEQYVGWRELPRSTDPTDAIQTEDDAWRVVCEVAGIPTNSSPLFNGISQQRAVAMALKVAHPDTGGDSDTLRKIVRAKELLAV